MKRIVFTLTLFLALLSLPAPARAREGTLRAAGVKPAVVTRIGVDQKIGDVLPLDATFRDEAGRTVHVNELLRGRPLVIVPMYFSCPMLCGQVESGLLTALKGMSLEAGHDFDVVFVSIDPRDNPKEAASRKARALEKTGKPETALGYHFLTGEQGEIERLTHAIGFRYEYDAKSGQYAHPAAAVTITPEGKISRYFYGIEFAPRDLRLGLVEASKGKLGTAIDRVLLLCYHYDPEEGRYSAATMSAVRLGGGLTVLALLGFVVMSAQRSRRANGDTRRDGDPR